MKKVLSAVVGISLAILLIACEDSAPGTQENNGGDTLGQETPLAEAIIGNWVQVGTKGQRVMHDGSPDVFTTYSIDPAENDSLDAMFAAITSDTLAYWYCNTTETTKQIELYSLTDDTLNLLFGSDKDITLSFTGDTLFIHHDNNYSDVFEEGYIESSYGNVTSFTLTYCMLPFEGSIPPASWPDSLEIR